MRRIILIALVAVFLFLPGCGSFQAYAGQVPLNEQARLAASSGSDTNTTLAVAGAVASVVLLGLIVGGG